LAQPDGSRGIWERIKIDLNQVVDRVRPDCTAEAWHAFRHAAGLGGRADAGHVADRLLRYLLSRQRPDGAFAFYERTDSTSGWQTDTSDSLYPNDNGKTLEMLTYAHRDNPLVVPVDRLARLADFLVGRQDGDGRFLREDGSFAGPCYVTWPVIGLARAFSLTQDGRHRAAALLGVRWLAAQQGDDGRLRTSFELTGAEAWRPASSETAEALRAFALTQRLLGEDLNAQIVGAADFLRRLTTPDGAIRNCDRTCLDAALQNDPSLTDLVYTDGYALHAWLDAWRATGDRPHLDAATSLAAFLLSIQTRDGSVAWDGAWRGSYDVDRAQWRGRADQRNAIDEGGAYSVYTGWCNATITNGLIRLMAAR
jgi:hypothetical protein